MNDLISLGPDGIVLYRRRMGVRFTVLQSAPWDEEKPGDCLGQVTQALPAGGHLDLVLDDRFSLLSTAGEAQDPLPLNVVQSDGVLTVTGRDAASLAIFSLSLGIETILETLQRFAPFNGRIERLIVRMPSKEFRTFVYLDWQTLTADPVRVDLALKVAPCIFVPHLVAGEAAQTQIGVPTAQTMPAPTPLPFLTPPPVTGAAPMAPSAPPQPPAAQAAKARRTLTLILPLSDDLRTSFLGFGYSVGASGDAARVLEIGAFRRNLRSSYSRLMGGTDVVDLKSQPPTQDVIEELKDILRSTLDDKQTLPCFIGSEVLSAEVLAIFRKFALTFDLAIQAIVCSAAPPSAETMALIETGLAVPEVRIQTVCFVPAGEPSGLVDATGAKRGYFGVPPVEGQSMARCMEFRSNVEDRAFIIPSSVPSREAHALERFINAFHPLQEDFHQKPAA